MRTILIVGAGQAGLQLALTLQQHDAFDVTVVTAVSANEIRGGSILSTQCMFAPALELERAAGLDFWAEDTPWIEGQRVIVAGPEGKMIEFYGEWIGPGQSLDQRVKMAGWLETFEERGGRVVQHPVATSDLQRLAADYDLTIIAAGRSDLVELFDLDGDRSPYTKPQRHLAAIYLHGTRPWPSHPVPQVRINAVPGVGELFVMPALTLTGPCDAALIEAVPGGPFDRWTGRRVGPEEHHRRLLELTAEWLPWEHELLSPGQPTDDRSVLHGAYPPVVRRPVGYVGDQAVFGMADVVVLNDPECGQGSNSAAHCAAIYYKAIVENADQLYTPDWMQATFDRFWEYAQYPTALTNMFIGPGIPEHVLQVLAVADQDAEVARRFAHGYASPPSLADWLLDPGLTRTYLAERATAAGQSPSEATRIRM